MDAVGSRGRTALAELARQNGDISLAKVLIDRGANSLTGSEKGESALEWAILGFHHELVELSLRSITARGYQSSRLDTAFRQYMLDENRFGVADHALQWRWFFIVKALKQFSWRS